MSLGSPSVLLIEEIVEILADTGKVAMYAAEVMEDSKNKDETYALAWMLYNVRQFKDSLVQVAFVLGGKDGRPVSDYYASPQPSLDQYFTLHDLQTKHSALRDRLLRTRIAYEDYINETAAVRLLFKVVDTQMQLMTWTLGQAVNALDV